jgi:hypothetical protein
MLALVANSNITETPLMAAARNFIRKLDPGRTEAVESQAARPTRIDQGVLAPQPSDSEADWEEPRRCRDRFLMILLRALSAWNT